MEVLLASVAGVHCMGRPVCIYRALIAVVALNVVTGYESNSCCGFRQLMSVQVEWVSAHVGGWICDNMHNMRLSMPECVYTLWGGSV